MPKKKTTQAVLQPQTTMVPMASLNDAAYNPRTITKRSLKGLGSSITEYGLLQPIVWNKRTGNVVGGHQRLKILKGKKVKEVSVIEIDVTLQREKEINAALNNEEIQGNWSGDARTFLQGVMAKAGKRASAIRLDKLTAKVKADVSALTKKAVADLKKESAYGEGSFEGDDTYVEVIDDVYFSAKNEWGIPDLLKNRLAKTCPKEVWGHKSESPVGKLILVDTIKWPKKCDRSYLGFYVDDFRFQAAWSLAKHFLDNLLFHDFKAIISPDFTVGAHQPPLVQLWAIYKARWCARYWQEAGFDVIPSLPWTASQANWAMAGIPKGVHTIAVQARTDKDVEGQANFVARIKQFIAALKPKVIMIYGISLRSSVEKALPKGVKYIWVEPFMEKQKKVRKAKKRAD